MTHHIHIGPQVKDFLLIDLLSPRDLCFAIHISRFPARTNSADMVGGSFIRQTRFLSGSFGSNFNFPFRSRSCEVGGTLTVSAVCGFAKHLGTINMGGFNRALPPRSASLRVLSATIWRLAWARFLDVFPTPHSSTAHPETLFAACRVPPVKTHSIPARRGSRGDSVCCPTRPEHAAAMRF